MEGEHGAWVMVLSCHPITLISITLITTRLSLPPLLAATLETSASLRASRQPPDLPAIQEEGSGGGRSFGIVYMTAGH